jgi:hypothetical protein
MPAYLAFRDWDLLYKGPWYPVRWTSENKIGYLTRSGQVIFPYWWGMKRSTLEDIKRHHKVAWIVELPDNLRDDDNIETFFTQNVDNPQLFFAGVNALKERPSYFDHPIKLPRLEPISPEEFEHRWAKLESILRPTDVINSIDTESRVSRLIARADSGTWSHTSGYLGNGLISEAIPPRVVVAPLHRLKHPRYRLGVYRPADSITPDQVRRYREFVLSQVGQPYAYRKVATIGWRKLLHLWPRDTTQFTPNEMIIRYDIPLIHMV